MKKKLSPLCSIRNKITGKYLFDEAKKMKKKMFAFVISSFSNVYRGIRKTDIKKIKFY